jgi:hypothetical protein
MSDTSVTWLPNTLVYKPAEKAQESAVEREEQVRGRGRRRERSREGESWGREPFIGDIHCPVRLT